MSDDFDYQLQQELRERADKEVNEQTNDDKQKKTFVDPKDGVEYEFNAAINGWVPKIDDDFIARYQSNYGCVTTDDSQETSEEIGQHKQTSSADSHDIDNKELTGEEVKDKKSSANNKKPFVSKLLAKALTEPKKSEWFEIDDQHNTKVYVTNLPLDITEDEFIELMKKCGLLAKDDKTNKFKVKLYRDSNGQLKGDGLCDYLKIESVQLALDILDGYQFKDKTIKVERARFSLKGSYDPNLKPKRNKKDKQKEKKKIQKLLDWRPEKVVGERAKCEKTVVIKNMFDPKEFLREPKLILEYRTDLREECTEKCGEVKRVDVYDCHPEGVSAVSFQEFDSADQCVQLMNGRFFAGRRLTAEHWDGKTRYKIEETEEEAEKRFQQWEQFLESEDKE